MIGIDCGLNGGISIIDDDISVCSMPVKKEDEKKVYDIEKILTLFRKYVGKDVVFCIERQGVRPGESGTSALTIGKNYGLLLGAAMAFGFNVIIVTPQKWKKFYDELSITPEIEGLRSKAKSLEEQLKTVKDKAEKKRIKKEADSTRRGIKVMAKDNARLLAAKLYPELAKEFALKKDDGKAEAVLIANFCKATYSLREGNNGLV